jgi:hypothetical protein
MLGDAQRFAAEGVLSVMVQETPAVSGGATPLRIVDYVFAD